MKKAETFAARIDRMVEKFGGQKPLARLLGVSDAAIIAWRGGQEPMPRTLAEIADRTGLAQDWLGEGRGDAEAEMERLAARLSEDPGTYRAHTSLVTARENPHCQRIIEHLTQRMSTEHFTEAQCAIMRDTTISPGEREHIVRIMAGVLAERLSAKQQKHQTKN